MFGMKPAFGQDWIERVKIIQGMEKAKRIHNRAYSDIMDITVTP